MEPTRRETTTKNNFLVRQVKSAFNNASETWQLEYSRNGGERSRIHTSINAMEYQLTPYRDKHDPLKVQHELEHELRPSKRSNDPDRPDDNANHQAVINIPLNKYGRNAG